MWRKYDQTACIPVRNQTWIIQCPKRAVSEWKFVTNWDQFSDKLQSWDSASFIPNERSISEVHLSVVIFISTPSHTYYRATFQDLSKILWIHVNSHRAKRSREGTRDSAYLAHYPHCVQVRGHCTVPPTKKKMQIIINLFPLYFMLSYYIYIVFLMYLNWFQHDKIPSWLWLDLEPGTITVQDERSTNTPARLSWQLRFSW